MRHDICNPGIFWFWNSDPTEKEIRAQVRSMAEAGFRSIYLHPMPYKFQPETFQAGMKMAYLGKKFMRLAGVALEACRENGVFMMIYDEGGWPSGSAVGRVLKDHPEYGGKYTGKDEHGKKWDCTSSWIVDLMNPEVTRYFIRLTHERYYRHFGGEFGRTIRGLFTDEPFWEAAPGVRELRVGPQIEEMAEKRYGCDFNRDILPYLYADAPESPERRLARARYFTITSELLKNNYAGIVREWCDAHGIVLEGHMNGEAYLFRTAGFGDLLEIMDEFGVPGVDAIWRQVYPGGEDAFYAKMAASIAIRNRLPSALCECFNVYGYGLTSPQMRHISNALIIRGINRILTMGYLSSDRGKHKLCCATDFSPRNPVWHAMPALNRYWRWACDFHAGALEASVWILAEPGKPFPPDPYTPSVEGAAAGKRIDDLCAGLDDAGIFWRYAGMTDLRRGKRPEVLLIPNEPADDRKKALLTEFLKSGVKTRIEDKNALACVDIADGRGCRVLPCRRPDGGSLMIFNPALEPVVFRFRSGGKIWREVMPPDSAASEVYPVETDENGIVSVPLPPGGLRILKTARTEKKFVPMRKIEIASPAWRIVSEERMEMHADAATKPVRRRVDRPLPASGLITDEDPGFSGIAVLECRIEVAENTAGFLEFASIRHAGELFVNGRSCGLCAFPPWVFRVRLKKGVNRLRLAVSGAGGNEWRRCVREEFRPRGWSNYFTDMVGGFSADDAECGVTGPVWIWTRT